MIKKIGMDCSKYTIEYDPERQWDYHIKRFDEDITQSVKNNVMNDFVFHVTENIEKGVKLESINVITKF